ncbi:MAG: flavodoxin family protein [Thermodesulfobacteriota bacterium]|nr:flavodoxin family protein [Thermodesulfobacteriota bacterium]
MYKWHEHIIRNKVLGVSGSPRKNGNSDMLLRQIVKGVNEQTSSYTTINLRDYQFSSCIGCEKCRKDKICTGLNDGMTLLYKVIFESKGLILTSPTHNYNVTAIVKAFIDRLYCFYEFNDARPRAWKSQLGGQGRKAIIAAICEQKDKRDMGVTLEAMRWPLEALGYEIIEEIAVFRLFDKGAIEKEEKVLEQARLSGIKLGKAIKKNSD